MTLSGALFSASSGTRILGGAVGASFGFVGAGSSLGLGFVSGTTLRLSTAGAAGGIGSSGVELTSNVLIAASASATVTGGSVLINAGTGPATSTAAPCPAGR